MAKNLDSLSPKPGEKIAEVIPPEIVISTPATIQGAQITEADISAAKTPNPDSFESLFPEPSVAIASPPTWIWWVLLVVSSIGLGIVGYRLVNYKVDSFIALSPTPTSQVKSSSALASATPTTSPISTPTPTTTATPTATPTTTPNTIDKSTITMRVLNGTAVNGAATTVKGVLEKAGFSVRTTGNAKTQTYTSTIIYYQTGKLDEAKLVQAALSQYSPTLQESTSVASPDIILVVYGG